MIPTLPNGQTLMLEKAFRLANLIEAEIKDRPSAPPGVIFLTAAEFGTMVRELTAKANGQVPTNVPREIRIGRVTFRNSGTDDVAVCMEANRQYAEQSGFAWKREHLITGKT